MRMKRTRARLLAALLTLVMVLTLPPAAAASSLDGCTVSSDGKHEVSQWETVVEADCITVGVRRGTCKYCKNTIYDETGTNQKNHAADCDDNGDGTHSGVCKHHSPNVKIDEEPHNFIDGVCKQCGAMDYEDVTLNVGSKNRTVNVAVGDVNAKLSAGDVKVLLGKVDVTDSYNLTYLWFYQGSSAGSGQECPLPAAVYDNEGTYYYTLMVSAMPKGSTSRRPVTENVEITVQVKDLISASAIVSSSDASLRLGEMDVWSADSVSGQIYDAVQDLCARDANPKYVRFTGDLPATEVGQLKANSGTYYTFVGEKLLDDVQFVTGAAAGDYTVDFTAYDSNGKTYAGVLTITVQQDAGDLDVLYTTARNTPVTLSPDEFEAYWNKVCPGGVLDSVSFDETPKSVEGTLYIDYVSPSFTGDRVRTSDTFYVEPGRYEYGIDAVTFVPGAKQSEYVSLGFTAYGTRSGGRTNTRRSGTMYIFLSADGRSADVTVKTVAGGTALPADDFQKAYQSATGGTGSSFYIQLLDVPESGDLYVGRTANRNGTRLTQANIQGRPFSYSDNRGETISSLTYVPGSAATESIRYVASSTQGKPLYVGKIIFTTASVPAAAEMTVPYASTSAGVTFRSADFETLPGAAAPKLSMVSFTPPSAVAGTLYYGRTATTTGMAITSDSSWFSVSTPAIVGANSMDNVTFVPAAGYSGPVTIPFTAINTSGTRSTGEVRITVTATTQTPDPGTTTPGTTTPGTTTPGTTVPAKTFPDVPQTEWYYRYVTDLTTSGVLNGYEDGTFRPNEAVSMGQALKMIMTAAGYPEQAKTGSHWASGYLTRAKADGLWPANANEDLDRRVSRYTIAEIAAKAMKLPVSAVTASPFSDMAVTEAAGPYVMALYNIGVITGSKDDATNTMIYQGSMAIRRKDFSAIIWRVRNYVSTGNVNGVAAAG